MKINAAKVHEIQLQDSEIRREIESVSQAMSDGSLKFQSGTVNFVLIKAFYSHFERKMTTVCVFVNKMPDPIKEMHGKLRLRFNALNAQIATATFDFDEPFMGRLNADEGLLVHINIPVKGLEADQAFAIADISGELTDVRVTNG